MCLIFSHILAFDSGRKTLCLLQKCKIMYENIVLSFFQTKLNKYWKNIWKEMQQILGKNKRTFTQVGFPDTYLFLT